MTLQKDDVIKLYGNKVRVRVCGIYVENSRILMVKHNSIGKNGYLWAPPGGGVEFGTSSEENLIKEFKEETGLEVIIKEFLFVHEFINPPLHAIELFYKVERIAGELITGFDPEMDSDNQIIKEVKYLTITEIEELKGYAVHDIFNLLSFPLEILSLRGYFRSS